MTHAAFTVVKHRGWYCTAYGDDECRAYLSPYRMTRFQAKKLAKRLNT